MIKKFNFLDKFGTLGAIFAAVSCPACFPLLGIVGTALGLGILRPYEGVLMYVFLGFVLIALLGNIIAFRVHRNALVLLIGVISPILIFFSFFIHFSYGLIYAGLTGLSLASVLNYLKGRKCQNCAPSTGKAQLTSIIKCPKCGFKRQETMPTDSCQFFYGCTNCKARLRPKTGDCCVFCSYGSVKCPSKQKEGDRC